MAHARPPTSEKGNRSHGGLIGQIVEARTSQHRVEIRVADSTNETNVALMASGNLFSVNSSFVRGVRYNSPRFWERSDFAPACFDSHHEGWRIVDTKKAGVP
jgi:hypothetical protein